MEYRPSSDEDELFNKPFISYAKVLECKASVAYESCMVHGSLRFVKDNDERKPAYGLLIDKYMHSDIKLGQKIIDKSG